MKKNYLFILFLGLLSQNILANAPTTPKYTSEFDTYVRHTLNLNPLDTYQIVSSDASCTVVKVYDSQKDVFFFQVIAAIFTALIPEIIDGICKNTIGDPDICNAVYNVTTALVAIRGFGGKASRTGRVGAFGWEAQKAESRSVAVIKDIATETIAEGVKSVFKSYKNECELAIPWENVSMNSETNSALLGDGNLANSVGFFIVENANEAELSFMWKINEPNDDSESWKQVTLPSHHEYRGKSDYSENTGAYHICVSSGGVNLYYKVFSNNRYRLTWNTRRNIWDLETVR